MLEVMKLKGYMQLWGGTVVGSCLRGEFVMKSGAAVLEISVQLDGGHWEGGHSTCAVKFGTGLVDDDVIE